MMGPRQEAQAALFYKFSREEHVPWEAASGHTLRISTATRVAHRSILSC